ncbi:MAG: 4-phosphopantoate--beta-alanine ligase [Thermoplasmata archaeon]
MKVPKSHPRYASLITRDKIVKGVRLGITSLHGLVAQGRGEAFDYLLGERTTEYANNAEKVAAALLLTAEQPVISVNGNAAALCGKEIVRLWKTLFEIRKKNEGYGIAERARIEVNLFHRSEQRVKKIISYLKKGYKGKLPVEILGARPNRRIPGLEHARALTSDEGVYGADVVLVPLEDGDRAEKLVEMGKKVIAIDLNPLSRTSRKATITIVDNIIRAIPRIESYMRELSGKSKDELTKMASEFDNSLNLENSMKEIMKNLEKNKEEIKN